MRYDVEGLTSLGSTNWVTLSPTITATDYLTTWCVPLPSPYQFFRVVEGVGLIVPPPPTIITLTNAIPSSTTNSAAGAIDYYRFVVSTNAARAQFEINGPSADVTLVARRGLPLPDLRPIIYISANPSTNDELIAVFTNSTPVALSAGDWYLSAVNVSGGPATYAIKATEWPLTCGPIILTNSTVITNSLCLTWTSLPGVRYHVEGLTALGSTNWVTVSPTITATGYSTTWCVPLPSPYQFFRVVERVGLVVPPPPTIITLTNAILYLNTNSGAGNATDYYRFVVSTNAARAQFEMNGPSADVTLVARKGLPLPGLASFDYISANPSTNDELIVVFTNSPVALSAGDWYLLRSMFPAGRRPTRSKPRNGR